MSDHFGRYLRKRDDAKRALADLISSAKHFGTPHGEMLECRAAIYKRLGNGTPHWVHSYLEGYWDRASSELYHGDLIFGGMIGDKFYSTHHDREDYYEKHGISSCDYADDGRVTNRGHYWSHNLKPFSTWS